MVVKELLLIGRDLSKPHALLKDVNGDQFSDWFYLFSSVRFFYSISKQHWNQIDTLLAENLASKKFNTI